MAQFSPALDFLLDFEDRPRRYNEVVDNNGGRVIAGINSRSYPQQEAAIAAAPLSQRPILVYQFYLPEFWIPLKQGDIDSQDIANRVLSAAVNTGQYTAIQMLQDAINALRTGSVTADGAIGPITIAAANAQDPQRLLDSYRQQLEARYRRIAANNPKDMQFIGTDDKPGPWIVRARA